MSNYDRVMPKEKLKKCPFCGGEAILFKSQNKWDVFWVECADCCVETYAYDNMQSTIEAWNARVKDK